MNTSDHYTKIGFQHIVGIYPTLMGPLKISANLYGGKIAVEKIGYFRCAVLLPSQDFCSPEQLLDKLLNILEGIDKKNV